MDNKRIIWIDWMKAILIYLVVVGHIRFENESIVNTFVNTFIYSFHMPAFFFISGFLHKKRTIKDYFITLIIPYLLFFLICWIFWVITYFLSHREHITVSEFIIRPLLGLILRNETAIVVFSSGWFLVALFFSKISTILYEKYYYNIYILIILPVVFCIFFNISKPETLFFITRTIMSIPFFYLGILVGQKKYLNILTRINSMKLVIITLLSFVLLIFINVYNGRISFTGYSFGNYKYLFYIGAIVGILFMVGVSILAEKIIGKHKIISLISTGTLVILGVHKIFITIITQMLPKNLNYPFIAFFIGIVIILLCGYVVVFCSKHIPILLGKISIQKFK
jgi:fucose 4-O-acetylase-like acetyltransferase